MSIAVIITDRNTDALCLALKQLLPGVEIQQWPQITHPEGVKLAVLWQHPPGITNKMPALKMVVSMGAGMDHILTDPHINANVQQERIVTLALKQNMAQYVLQHVLAWHRHRDAYLMQQKNHHWQVLESDQPLPTVGFLGLGALGSYVADRCADLGFSTMAYTATQRHPEHPCFHGQAGLQQVCQSSQFLVVLLPLTESTEGIINQQTLGWCQPDTVLIHVARGAHVKQHDLLEALEQGLIKHAVMDVFDTEPLPADHPYWSHPKMTITPHSSSRSDIQQTAEQIAEYHKSIE